MRRLPTTLAVATTAALLGTAGTVLAYADGWTLSDGKATFTLKVAKMPRGVTPSAAKQGKTAVVSWSAQEIAPDVRMDHYVITAHSVSEPPLPDVTRTVTASGGNTESVTFTAAQVAGGRWHWTIVPKFRSWTGAESGTSQRLTFPATTKAEAATDAAAEAAVAPAGMPAPKASSPAKAPADPPAPDSPSSPATEPKDPPAADPPAPETTSTTTNPPAEPTTATGSAPTNIPG